jgi:hypothetical protein
MGEGIQVYLDKKESPSSSTNKKIFVFKSSSTVTS